MRFYLLIVLTLVNISCGNLKDFLKQKTETLANDIMEIRDTYLDLVKGVQDASGFIEYNRCDSLLFSGLLAVDGGSVVLTNARDEKTLRWYRTPYKDCLDNQRQDLHHSRRSGSSISRDGLMGAFWGLRYQNNLPALNDLINYGRDHKWVMGEGSLDRTYMTPNMQKTLYIIQGKTYKGLPNLWIDPIKAHQRHIVALNIILRGERQGKINESMLNLLKDFVNHDPGNALFQYGVHRFTDGDQSKAIAILQMFPVDRLPTNKDWKNEWLWSRHSDSDSRQPSDTPTTHSGGDLIFIAGLIERSVIE